MTTIVCAQLNVCVGDTEGNLRQILTAVRDAKAAHSADIVIFPELALTGYPPEDLLYRSEYLLALDKALEEVKAAATDIAIVIGHVEHQEGKLYNAVSIFSDRFLKARYRKQFLPNTGVFDEKRYFTPGNQDTVVVLNGLRCALAICEDIWHVEMREKIRLAQADVLLIVNASPFDDKKLKIREKLLSEFSMYVEHPVIYVNLVGGQDSLVFDGGSCAFNAHGECASQAPWFEPCLWPITFSKNGGVLDIVNGPLTMEPSRDALIYRAVVLATRDYCEKNGFRTVLLGLSGGIDSALCLAILSDALGKDAVQPFFLPSPYTSELSEKCALAQCEAMQIPLKKINIDTAMESLGALLAQAISNDIETHKKTLWDIALGRTDKLAQKTADVLSSITAQNIQARIRAVLLMGMSNQTGALLISTGNKSEYAMGYTTLYGDMAGAFAPLKDVYKTDVFRLARYRNSVSPIIPEEVIERAPSAELAPNQRDEDHLPPYVLLDEILEAYLEGGESLAVVAAKASSDIDVARVIRRIYQNEYKRRQAPPGPKVSALAFGSERRYPITSTFGG